MKQSYTYVNVCTVHAYLLCVWRIHTQRQTRKHTPRSHQGGFVNGLPKKHFVSFSSTLIGTLKTKIEMEMKWKIEMKMGDFQGEETLILKIVYLH